MNNFSSSFLLPLPPLLFLLFSSSTCSPLSSSSCSPLSSSSSLPPPALLSLPQLQEKMSEVAMRQVFLVLIHSIACLHSILDQNRIWRSYFIHEREEKKKEKDWVVVPVPSELVPFFISISNMEQIPLHFNLCHQLYSDLKIELLHMMGALLSSHEVISFFYLEPNFIQPSPLSLISLSYPSISPMQQ